VSIDGLGVSDALHIARGMARDALSDGCAVVGYGTAALYGPDGELLLARPFANLITDVGDAYYAAKAIVGVGPAAPAAPSSVSGMQIGSGTAAAAKSGSGSSTGSFLAGLALDSGYPIAQSLGAGNGVQAVYRTTFPAGTGTGNVTEAVLTTGTVTTASSTASTIARTVFSAVPKGSSDSLQFTWQHVFRGA